MTKKRKLMGVGGGGLEEGGGAHLRKSPSPPPPISTPIFPPHPRCRRGGLRDDHAGRLVAGHPAGAAPWLSSAGWGARRWPPRGCGAPHPRGESGRSGPMEVVGHWPAIWQALRGIGRVLKRPGLTWSSWWIFPTSISGWPAWPEILPGAGATPHEPPGPGAWAHHPGAHPVPPHRSPGGYLPL